MSVDAVALGSPTDATRGALREATASLASVFRNPALRRVQVALAVSMIWDWAFTTAVTVWAFEVGGAKTVGIFGAVRYVLMALFAPFAATLSDRFPRKAVMVGAELLQLVATVAAAVCLVLDTPNWPVFVLATLCTLLGCVFRPAQMALMPTIADTPEELAASNGASSTIESLAFFLGPALAALLLAVFDVETVFFLNAASFAVSSLLIAGIRVPRRAEEDESSADGSDGDDPLGVTAGFAAIGRDRDLLMVTALVATQTIVAGASLVLTVVFATSILDTGSRGVGYIDSAFGVGAIAGGLGAIAVTARPVMARSLGLGVVMWSVPLLAVAAWPEPVTVLAAAIVMGFGNPLVDVNYATLTQRLSPDEVLGRVFGAGEGIFIGTMALGAAVTPFLLEAWGLRPTVIAVAVVAGVPPLVLLERCRRLDRTLVPPEGLDLLRTIPMFAPLGPARLEALARRLEPVELRAGHTVVIEGDEGDRFFVIASGAVDVDRGTRVIRLQTPGDFFGEIALLRDVPRNATVKTVTDTRFLALDRGDFLEAVAGADEAWVAANDVVARRIPI